MPRDDEDDDYDDAPRRRRSAPIPAGVKAAGMIWIGFGVLGFATVILSFMVTVAVENGKGAGGICGVIIPIAFLIVGIQSVKGTAPGTMGNGIGSIIFGLLYLGIAVLVLASSALGAGAIAVVLGGLSALLGTALLTAGVLASPPAPPR